MESLIDDLTNRLAELKDHLRAAADADARREQAEASLQAVSAQLDQARDELAQTNAGLTSAQLRSTREHDEAIFAKRKELESLAVKTSTASHHLAELNAHVTSATARHDQIQASIQSLRTRLG